MLSENFGRRPQMDKRVDKSEDEYFWKTAKERENSFKKEENDSE